MDKENSTHGKTSEYKFLLRLIGMDNLRHPIIGIKTTVKLIYRKI
jgi:hypothetical protein